MPNFSKRETGRAKEFRNGATPPERLLWGHLRKRQLAGHKFSRQIPVGPYFCDFICREKKLIIELDGASHSLQTGHDRQRDAYCEQQGYTVLRFSNVDVMTNVEGVLTRIEQALASLPTPRSLPQAGGGVSDQSPSRLREGLGVGQKAQTGKIEP
jgi:very-short-patch-repair endonuclease